MEQTTYKDRLFAAYAKRPQITVEIEGTRHMVPDGLTVLQSMWYAGVQTTHGAGCLGGACGACTASCRVPDSMAPVTGLACQMEAVDGMTILLYPIDPPQKPRYRMAEIDDPAASLFDIYPETRRCTLCDACTTVCPQDIPVKTAVGQMMNRQFEPVAESFDECVMCGFCTLVCEVGIAPNLLGVYARKAVGCKAPAPEEITRQMEKVAAGGYENDWKALLNGDGIEAACRALLAGGKTSSH